MSFWPFGPGHDDQKEVLRILRNIVMTQNEMVGILGQLKQDLTATKAIVVKVGTETDGLQQAIKDLQAVIAANPVSPEVAAALADVVTAAQSVADAAAADDAKVPDAPTTT